MRTLNPAKPELGRVSKKILEGKIQTIREKSQLNQWKNTNSVIKWFKGLSNKKKLSFLIFDVEKFYPSISKNLLIKALKWARKYVELSDEEIEVILAARKAFLYLDGEPWTKKGEDIFDVGMGFYDGAEVCELVGLFILEELQELGINVGIYRDDGLGVSDLSPRGVERIKKQMSAIFRKHSLEITIEANKKRVEFLDVYMDLQTQDFGPYLKPGDTPVYVDVGSNHPPKVLENIPKGINRRLSSISATKEIFDKAVPVYQSALEKSGHSYILNFEDISNQSDTAEANKHSKTRKRSIIWFNPPFSKAVKTNVGKQFLTIMDKHFPPGNPLNSIFNRNKVKMSYRCTPNLARKVSAHNAKIMKSKPEKIQRECDCRIKENCPVENKCLRKGVVYQATITRDDQKIDTYIGLTATTFKERWRNHRSNFKTRNPKNSTSLSKYVLQLQDQNVGFNIGWKIVSSATPFNHVTNECKLCVREKYFIIFKPEMATLNDRNEIAGPCLHKHGQLLKKSKS